MGRSGERTERSQRGTKKCYVFETCFLWDLLTDGLNKNKKVRSLVCIGVRQIDNLEQILRVIYSSSQKTSNEFNIDAI